MSWGTLLEQRDALQTGLFRLLDPAWTPEDVGEPPQGVPLAEAIAERSIAGDRLLESVYRVLGLVG